MVLPDYHGGSIVNLMATISRACGAPQTSYPPLDALGADKLERARNIILIVIDGLGYNFLMQHGSYMRERITTRVTSLFPSTTATAITAFMTGVAAQQHGLTGWFTWFKEVGSVIAPLPFKPRHNGRALNENGIQPAMLFAVPSLFDSLKVPATVISPKNIVHSAFNVRHCGRAQRVAYDGSRQFFRAIEAAAKADLRRKFIYAYYPELDSLAHVHGIGSWQVKDLFAKLDSLFGEFLSAMSGSESAILVCADHGFVDIEHTIELDKHPALAETLMLPLCGERRIAYCYVRRGCEERFKAYVAERFSDYVELRESRMLIDEGWFGLGTPHPALNERVGDFALVMKGRCAIKDWVQGETRHHHIGAHGGVSEDEMFVPLVVAFA
ncbi:MAG: alkaline phosphatase family protein [Burkholderiales bacterium]